MQAHREVDLRSTARTALIVAWSLLALFGEALLLLHLWWARTQSSVPASSYVLAIAHLLPWLAGMRRLWMVRRALRNGTLDSSRAALWFDAISDFLCASYVALMVAESMIGSAWKF
jgi:hypothetical protein